MVKMRMRYKLRYLHVLCVILVVIFRAKTSESITAKVNCDDRSVVYADGQQQKEEGESNHYWSDEIPDDTKLLAVQCYNGGGFGGFIVSVGDILISDSTWKCTKTRYDNWYETDFVDDTWSSAYVLGDNRGEFRRELSQFEEYVQWIWADDTNQDRQTVYCRGRTGVILHARCNDKCDVYADEQLIASEVGNSVNKFWNGAIPRTTRVISVAGENTGGTHAFIVIGTSIGFKTTIQWKCTDEDPDGWTAVDYDDSSWTDAVVQGHPSDPSITIEDMFGGAKPIWIKYLPNDVNTWSRCRGRIECGCEYTCDVNGDEFTCLCEKGYTLNDDGRTCRDIDECTEEPLHDCKALEECLNRPGAVTCQCLRGYTSNNGGPCMDIDECAGDHGCSNPFHCENTPGSFECACQSGYRRNGGTCNNIDECAEKTDDCSQVCKDVPGDFTCQCYNGYVPKSPGSKTCSDSNECQTDAHNCSGLFECSNTQGGFDCLCKDGYILERGECIDIDECDQSNSTCEHVCGNTDGSFVCSCNIGFVLQPDVKTCAPQSRSGGEGSDSPVAIIAAVIAVIIVLVIVIVLVLLILRRRRKKQQQPTSTKEIHQANGDSERIYYNTRPGEVNIGFDNIGGNEYAAVKESNAEELPTFSSRYRAVESPPHPCCEQAARPYENVPGTTQSASPDYETIAKPAEEPYESLSERIQYANSNVSPYESLQSGPN